MIKRALFCIAAVCLRYFSSVGGVCGSRTNPHHIFRLMCLKMSALSRTLCMSTFAFLVALLWHAVDAGKKRAGRARGGILHSIRRNFLELASLFVIVRV